MNIASLLFARARQFPDAPALTFGSTTTSFRGLANVSASMAGALRNQLAIKPGDRVVLWMENRREFIETLFACWVAGACVVPANFKLHPLELKHIALDSEAQVIFTSSSLAETLEAAWGEGPCPQIIAAESAVYTNLSSSDAIPIHDAESSDLAWLFYTSGTTGFPKGARLSHRNLIFMSMTYYTDIEHVTVGQTMIIPAPLSHGAGQYMLPHLLAGGHQLVLSRFDPAEILQACEHYPQISIFMVPTMITRLVQSIKQAGIWKKGNIRSIIYGGAPMYVADLIKAMELIGSSCFYQLYGQGETPMTATGLNQQEHEQAFITGKLEVLATCGTPRTGVEVRVVDQNGCDVMPNQPGEIITRSDCVMAGYWNNNDATTSALRNGWLWTGDIGTLDEHGYLSLRDRSKDMIISGGTNIYPREIEEVLLTHPAVSECSVVGRVHHDLGEETVAFIVTHPDACVKPEELDSLCLSKIARFKRPRHYRYVEALPKSSYGKILKTVLREQLKQEAKDQQRLAQE